MNWYAVTRLGEAQLLLPAALLASGWLTWRLGAGATAKSWLSRLAMAIALTTISKLAFIGWGLGIASLDFTGFSGHAMFAAAVYPMLARMGSANVSPAMQRSAVALGVVFAMVIAYSRVEVRAHSVSEVIAGSMLGLFVSIQAMKHHPIPPVKAAPWVPIMLLLGLAAMPWKAPPSLSHQLVTQVALTLSQRPYPYTRAHLHRYAGSPELGADASTVLNIRRLY
jgi:hypothetical protein